MICRRGKKPEVSSEELKTRILTVAKKHFAMHGLAGASLKHIAKEAEVAGSLLNYHFKDKDGLFRAAIEPFTRDRAETLQRILSEPKTGEDMRVRLELFIEEIQTSVLADSDNFEILDREMRAQNPIVFKIFEETLLKSFMSVVNFFDKAKENGLLKEDTDPQMLAAILFTASSQTCRKNEMAEKFFKFSYRDPEYRRKFAKQLAEMVLRGVMK